MSKKFLNKNMDNQLDDDTIAIMNAIGAINYRLSCLEDSVEEMKEFTCPSKVEQVEVIDKPQSSPTLGGLVSMLENASEAGMNFVSQWLDKTDTIGMVQGIELTKDSADRKRYLFGFGKNRIFCVLTHELKILMIFDIGSLIITIRLG